MSDNINYHLHSPKTTNVNSKTTITEHRAPTDDSVKLLKEMEEKAREKLHAVYSVSLPDVGIEARVVSEKNFAFIDRLDHYALVQINGREFKVGIETEVDLETMSTDELIKVLEKALTEAVSAQIMLPLFQSTMEIRKLY